ncbi:MAG: ROK family protein [Bacteroidota bacterium]
MANAYIGVDLGGTNFKAGCIEEGRVTKTNRIAVGPEMTEGALLEVLYTLIQPLMNDRVNGIGVGVPGIVDPQRGTIYDIQNLPAWQEVALGDLLQDRFNTRVLLDNDANCFALGEHRFGSGQGYQNFVGISIGTGLGMGVIIDRQLYNGSFCGAGEIGMIPYKDGIVEHYAGSFFFERFYKQSAREAHELAQGGQAQAIQAFEMFGHHLGEAIKIVLHAYAPEAIVLGGSISKAYDFFKEGMHASLRSFTFQKQLDKLEIKVAQLPNVAILGTGALCMD